MNPSDDLRQFLHNDLPKLALNERCSFDHQVGSIKGIVIYGCGKLGQTIAEALVNLGQPPVAFADKNKDFAGKKKLGIEIYSPTDAIEAFGKTHSFVVTVWRDYEIIKQILKRNGAQCVVHFLPLLWKYSSELLPYYNLTLPSKMLNCIDDIKLAFSLFKDEQSQEEFVFQLKWMTSLRSISVPNCRPIEEQYFPVGTFDLASEETFIDCGAYVGDTVEAFLKRTGGKFRQIVAVEPDKKNIVKLENFVHSLPGNMQKKIRIDGIGLGLLDEIVAFDSTASESSAISLNGSVTIQIKQLDKILIGTRPTFIKMDIEGSELDALKSGENIIQKFHPKLAVCVYHVQDHLWQIPLEMNRLNPYFDIYLHRYADEFGDVVCYSVPKIDANNC